MKRGARRIIFLEAHFSPIGSNRRSYDCEVRSNINLVGTMSFLIVEFRTLKWRSDIWMNYCRVLGDILLR